ncbi:response regulator [bacterium]|nr:MAG: response regulator [bacterium]
MTPNKPLRVLICEDETILREWLARSVQQMGHEVVGRARDGIAAQELARTMEPDFIIMDIKMPRCDGLTATAEIMRGTPLPILILTAYSDSEAVTRALEAGAAGYLVKPIDTNQLAPAITLAYAKFKEVSNLRHQEAALRETLEQRKIVERAKGLLMRTLQFDEESAHRMLQRLASQQRQPIHEVSKNVIAAAESGKLAQLAATGH